MDSSNRRITTLSRHLSTSDTPMAIAMKALTIATGAAAAAVWLGHSSKISSSPPQVEVITEPNGTYWKNQNFLYSSQTGYAKTIYANFVFPDKPVKEPTAVGFEAVYGKTKNPLSDEEKMLLEFEQFELVRTYTKNKYDASEKTKIDAERVRMIAGKPRVMPPWNDPEFRKKYETFLTWTGEEKDAKL